MLHHSCDLWKDRAEDCQGPAAAPQEPPPKLGSPLGSPKLSSPELEAVGARQSDGSGSYFYQPLVCWASKPKLSRARRNKGAETQWSAMNPTPMDRPCGVLNPTGHFRNLWDFVGISLLILDTMILPLQFVNENIYSIYPYLAVITRIAVFYWVADILLSFTTGYLKTLGTAWHRREATQSKQEKH
eukprot:Skav215183  [mRNA]  locus=scaffold3330:50749:51306:- [translate_table: standard]